MKHAISLFVIMLLILAVASEVVADNGPTYAWHELAPPILLSPAPNAWFAPYQSITYSWDIFWGTPGDSIDYFELQFANGHPNDAINLFAPDEGRCEWDTDQPRIVSGYNYTTDHQDNHEPIYWRVRAVFKNGCKTNWAISYHRVGDHAEWVSPPTILSPQISKYDCNPSVFHEWASVEGASHYEYAWSQAFCNSDDLLDECSIDIRAPISGTSLSAKHDCVHLPIYFLVRGVFPDGTKTNWAITYYCMINNCILCGGCGPVGTETSSWGSIKQLHR